MSYTGSCYCKEIQYELALNSPEEEARTSICYCENCKVRMAKSTIIMWSRIQNPYDYTTKQRWTGSAFGITTKYRENLSGSQRVIRQSTYRPITIADSFANSAVPVGVAYWNMVWVYRGYLSFINWITNCSFRNRLWTSSDISRMVL